MNPRRLMAFELLSALLGAPLLLAPPPARAGKNPSAKIILHLLPWNNRNTCAGGRVISPDKVVTRGDLFPARYTAYVLVTDGAPGEGIAGMQFGIAFNDSVKRGVDVLDWQECSLFNWPSEGWPTESASGNMLTWNQSNDCDSSGVRVAGYFYITAYSPDRLRIIPRPADGKAAVISCGVNTASRDPEVIDVIAQDQLGFVDFGGGTGYNPWDPRQNLARLKAPGKGISPRERTPESRPAGGQR